MNPRIEERAFEQLVDLTLSRLLKHGAFCILNGLNRTLLVLACCDEQKGTTNTYPFDSFFWLLRLWDKRLLALIKHIIKRDLRRYSPLRRLSFRGFLSKRACKQ